VAERQILGDAIHIGGVHRGRTTEMASALGFFGLSQVAVAGVMEQDLASAGYLEPLGHGLFRFDAFGTSHKS
jgi:hypothetical protein